MQRVFHLLRDSIRTALLLIALSGSAADATEFLPETLIQLDPAHAAGIVRSNRNNQVATLYGFSDFNPGMDQLAYFSRNSSQQYELLNTRMVAMSMSNWGITTWDFQSPGTAVWAAPFGEPLREIFRTGPNGNTTAASLNDAGTLAFFARQINSHGLRDAYVVFAGQPPQLLPELFEDALYEPPMIDQQNRVIARKEFTVPEFALQMFRYDEPSQWVDLTSGELPQDVAIQPSSGVQGERIVSSNGDFVFPTVRQTAEGPRFEVVMYDTVEDVLLTVFDRTAEIPGWMGEPTEMNTEANFADDGSLWLFANGFRFGFPPVVRSVVRHSDGTVLDVEQLLPEGLSLRHEFSMHSMNYRGDLWIAAQDEQRENSYFLFHDGRLLPVLQGTADVLQNAMLTDDLQLYYWHETDESTTFYRVLLVPEPAAMVMLCGLMPVLRRRRNTGWRASGNGHGDGTRERVSGPIIVG